MRIYLTTRYTAAGTVLWQRISFRKGQYAGGLGAARSSLYNNKKPGGRVTLHYTEVADEDWVLLKDENSPTGNIDIELEK